jgi:selenocysteine-specific elongation factor
VAVDAAPPTWIVDVRLKAVDTTDRAMKQRERVRFHLGASEIFGRVTFFDRDELEPGGSAVAQIRLESPLVALRGDRFVLRWYSPMRTAAGGRVIDPGARKRRRSDADAVQTLDLLDSGTTTDRVLTLLGGCPSRGLTVAEIAAPLGATESEIESATLELSRADHIARLGADRWVGIEWRRQIESIIEEAARAYQERFPLRFGIQLGEVRSRLQGRLEPEAVDAAIQELVQMGRAHVDGDRMRVGNDRLQLPDAERREADRILEMLEGAELSVPATKQLLAAVRTADPQELLVFLAGQGEIVRLTPDLCYTRGQLERLQARVVERFRDHPTMSVADFKGLFEVSRKFAVPLLEYLDQCGITRRSGDSRVPGRRLTTGEPATG